MSVRQDRGHRPGRPVRERPDRNPRRGVRKTHGRMERLAPLAVVLSALVIALGLEVAIDRGWVRPAPAGAVVTARDGAIATVPSPRPGRPAPELNGGAPPPANAARPPSAALTAPSSPLESEPPPCTFDDRPAPNAGLDDWATTLVDTADALPDDYRPNDLVPVGRAGIGGSGLVRSLVIDDLQ